MTTVYKCEACGATCTETETWSSEKAFDEAAAIFGAIPAEDMSAVCDVCWRQMMGLPPEESHVAD